MLADVNWDYKVLPIETKLFLNKAIDIYSSIKDKKIDSFSDVDKRILSLLASSLMVQGDLKDLLSKYRHDINLDKVLDFMEISDKDIKTYAGDYQLFYDKNFRRDLMNLQYANLSKSDGIKSPVLIFSYFESPLVMESNILNEFAISSNSNVNLFKDYPLFKDINDYLTNKNFKVNSNWNNYLELDSTPEVSEKPKIKPITIPTFSFPSLRTSGIGYGYGIEYEKKTDNKEFADDDNQANDEDYDYWYSDKLWDILEEIKAKFIGQERAVEDIFYNIVNNQRMILNGELEDSMRSTMFIDGPSGTGKTAIIREICSKLDIPFKINSITNFSPAGYHGDHIQEVLTYLYKMSKKNIKKAEKGIVVFDEFDKVVYNPENGNSLDLKKAVQQQLLDFMGGGTYQVPVVQNPFANIEEDFETSKLTFICMGALTDLRKEKSSVNRSIGFNCNVDKKTKEIYEITQDDLIKLGYETELVARLNTFLHTDDYSEEDYLRILKESTISPMRGFEKWVESYNKKLVVEDGVYEVIAKEAYKLDKGARSLQNVMISIRTIFLKQVMRSKDNEVYLDVDTVYRACGRVTTRKSR